MVHERSDDYCFSAENEEFPYSCTNLSYPCQQINSTRRHDRIPSEVTQSDVWVVQAFEKHISTYQVCVCTLVLLTVLFGFLPKSLNSTLIAYFKGPVRSVSLSELPRFCWLWQEGFRTGPVFLILVLEGQTTRYLFSYTSLLLPT